MIQKKCNGYATIDGKKNPDCAKTFDVYPCHIDRKTLCDSCQKLKRNEYQRGYLRAARAKKKENASQY
jgi:hypothetical protein